MLIDDKMTDEAKLGCESCGSSVLTSELLIIDGQFVNLPGLDDLMESVRKMKVSRRKTVADELLSRAKAKGLVPPGEEDRYRSALMDEYDRRYLTIM